jgi:methyl-accepting chemotaxis protein
MRLANSQTSSAPSCRPFAALPIRPTCWRSTLRSKRRGPGNTGAGFAVVADEVRSLAARTSQATLEIVDVVRKNHDLSLSAVSSMQSSLSRTGLGVELANEAGEVILEIQQGSRHVVDAISQFNETLQLN